VSRIALVCAAALAAAAGGCANVTENIKEANWSGNASQMFAKPDWAKNDVKTAELGPKGPVGPDDLVGPDGRCGVPAPAPVAQAAPEVKNEPPPDRPVGSVAGDLAGMPMPAGMVANASPAVALPDPSGPQVLGGIGLGMTECDAVRRAGTPSNVSIGNNEKGERKVVLTFLNPPWPGIYTFASGRLNVIERAPTPPPSAKAPPKKKIAAKPRTAAQ
jgi:hypothetical protein